MPVSAISFYRGGSVEDVTPLAKRMKEVLRKYGVSYEVSRFEAAEDTADWIVIVRYADWTAYTKTLADLANDHDHRQAVADISKHVTFIRRELAIDLDL